DKILVGEIRDSETAQIAIQAALTGHLVFTTVHANNVFDVIGRFIHMGIEPYNFVTSLNCVLAQRLIRLICVECKRERKMDDDFFELMKVSGLDLKDCKGKIFYEGAGCEECFYTGYRHRKAILELLDLTDEIRDLISEKASPSVIKKKALSEGMLSLRQTALVCMFEGETTLEEINRVTFVE
ncbi:MAG: Flp pilus assembly complex ATPase component TadA, partial [Deltaproteobacteria bacterium]|nr:Flp pilus assembly complex ATPase component TadA [Deltaproteobacteria bacterium]